MVRDANTSRIPNPLAYSSAPYWPLFILDFYFFLLIFKNVWRNSMKLCTNDRSEKTHTPACLRTNSPNAAPPIGHFYFRFWLFVLIFKTVWWISMKLHTNDRRREYLLQLIFENTSPQQRPLAAIFILWRPFWNLFLLITSKPFDGFQRNFTQVIDGERCQHQSISEPTRLQ